MTTPDDKLPDVWVSRHGGVHRNPAGDVGHARPHRILAGTGGLTINGAAFAVMVAFGLFAAPPYRREMMPFDEWNVPLEPPPLRERLICAAVSGLASTCLPDYSRGASNAAVADRAIAIADAVIERLERKEG